MNQKKIVVHLYNGICLGNKKGENTTDTCNNKNESQKHYISERSQDPKATYHMIPFI